MIDSGCPILDATSTYQGQPATVFASTGSLRAAPGGTCDMDDKAALVLFIWRALVPAGHCRAAVTARSYRVSVALPGLVTGVVPVVAGIAPGAGWLALVGAFYLTLAAGDGGRRRPRWRGRSSRSG